MASTPPLPLQRHLHHRHLDLPHLPTATSTCTSHSPSTPVVSSDELAKQLKRISDHLSELTTTSTLGGSLNSARARRKPTQKMSSIKSAVNPYSRLMLLNEQGVVKDYYRVRIRTVQCRMAIVK